MICLENLTKKFNNKKILDNLSLTIEREKIHILLGESGSGKTTLLSILAGLSSLDNGRIILDGVDITKWPPNRRNIGYVFQHPALFPHLSVYKNVSFGLEAIRTKEEIIKKRVFEILEITGTKEQIHQFPETLSGGQKQRVSLARALVLNPDILLLDEPFSQLDANIKAQLQRELLEIQKIMKITILLVSHDKNDAFKLADRAFVLHNGKIEQEAKPEQIYYHPKTRYVANFVGIPNIFKASLIKLKEKTATFRLEHGDNQNSIEVQRYPLFDRKKEILFCIHPDHIKIFPEKTKNNTFHAKVIKIDKQAVKNEITIDFFGHVFLVTTNQNFERGNSIQVHFPSESIHPLCGKKNSLWLTPSICRRTNANPRLENLPH